MKKVGRNFFAQLASPASPCITQLFRRCKAGPLVLWRAYCRLPKHRKSVEDCLLIQGAHRLLSPNAHSQDVS